jgi:cytochrome c biogenesis protein
MFRDYPLKRNETVQIEGSDFYMKITDLAPDVVISSQNQLVPQGNQYKGSGAAIMVFLDSDGKIIDKASIIDAQPGSQPRNLPYSFDIVDYYGSYYTGLQVTYDPGVLVVYTGFSVMIIGIFVAFFIFHKRLWAWVRKDEKGRVVVTVAGSVNKNRQAYERDIDEIVEKIKS